MKVVVLYRPQSEHGTKMDSFVRDFQRRYPSAKVEAQNVDDRDGLATASLYDIMNYPAILVMAVDGTLLHMWLGAELPLMDEVASYLVAAQG